MRKLSVTVLWFFMAALVLSLSGCGGPDSNIGSDSEVTVEQVVTVSSPALEMNGEYQIYRGATFNGMGDAKYFIAPGGSTATTAGMNLGFTTALGSNESLAIVRNGTTEVVYAYNPSGLDDAVLSADSVTLNNKGTILSYNGHEINRVSPSFFTAMNVDTSQAKTIQLNGNTATFDGAAIVSFDHVWHVSPDHREEYYTEGLNGTELTSAEVIAATKDQTVYIDRDVRYMPNYINFTGTAKNDNETEYVAYYSANVSAEVYAELGTGFAGPYIFATLPQSEQPGGGQQPGGQQPGGQQPGGQQPGGGQPGGQQPGGSNNSAIRSSVSNSDIAYFSTMTHSPSDAYNNPVLHIAKSGVYRLTGTWNGQIWIDATESAKAKTDSTATVTLILDNVTVTCGVAPAIVFHDLYECGPDDATEVADKWKEIGAELLDNAGAKVIIADDSTNTFTGANVYRLLKAEKKKDSVTAIDGSDVSQQKKRYKMDGAFYSFVSMAIGGGSKANGVLNIKSTTFEGLDAELHMTIESGAVTVYAHDDGINVNEDDVSVFSLLGGSLKITSEVGDGIDSNGYVAILGGSLDITAGSQRQASAGEAGIDAEKDVHIYDDNAYTWTAYSGRGTDTGDDSGDDSGSNNNTSITPTETRTTSYGVVYVNQSTPAEGQTAAMSVTTTYGKTDSSISGNTNSMLDTTGARYTETSGNIFKLENKNNTFVIVD